MPDADAPVTTPCGACRHAIEEFDEKATVFCANLVREEEGLNMFANVERYTAEELCPANRSRPTWE